MRVVRPFLIVSAILWLFFSVIHWRTEVPLSPTVTFDPSAGLVFLGFTPDGELLLAHLTPPAGERRRATQTGPIEVWSFPDCIKRREVFTKDDIIESLAIEPHTPTVIRHKGQPWIADLATGELQHQLPPGQPTYMNARLAGPTRVLSNLGGIITCFDFIEQQEVWRLPDHDFITLMSPRYAVIQRSSTLPDPRARQMYVQFDMVDLATGKVDDRLKSLQYRDLSPDGRRAVVTFEYQLQVIDLETAGVVWQSPEMASAYFNATFSSSGEELIVDYIARDGDILTARINAATGGIIEPGSGLRPGFMSAVRPSVTTDRRFAVYRFFREPSRMRKAVREFRIKCTGWFGSDFPPPLQSREETVVFDLSLHERLGFVDHTYPKITLSPANTAFAISSIDRPGPPLVEVHPLPPRTNWRWLVQYAVLPPMILVALNLHLRRRHDAILDRQTPGKPNEAK